MRTLALAALLTVIFAPLLSAAEKPAAAKPLNLLLITADDLNGDSMGWMGSKLGATPAIDAFAATCCRFELCHVSAPICQPSRSALMTGRVPHRNGALGFNPIRLDVPTMPEVLGAKGYYTVAINKIPHMAPAKKFPWDQSFNGSGKNPRALRDDLEQALKGAKEKGRPFFINANITDPHRPFPVAASADKPAKPAKPAKAARQEETNKNLARVYKPAEVVVPSFLEDIPLVRQEVAQYFTAVARMDKTFSEILAVLKESGQADQTIVLFMSDHGMSFPYSKATLYRNGTSTPLLLRFPGMEKAIVNRDDFISSVDIMPTLLELLAVDRPDGMDGRSFVPLLHGEKQTGRDHVFTHVNTVSSGKSFPGRCVRSKTRSYIWNAWPDGKTQYRVEAMSGLTFQALQEAAGSDAKIKERVQHFLYRTAEEFYDLSKDPDERRNLIGDSSYQKEIGQMRKLILTQMEKTDDPLLGDFRKLVKP